MKRKGKKRSDDEEKRLRRLRAIKAKQADGAPRDRSRQARRAADARWKKYRDNLPKHSVDELAAIQAKRTKRARLLDSKSTSENLLDPHSDLTHLWVKDPTHFDVRGLDDVPQEDRRRPRKPLAKGSRGKEDRKAGARPAPKDAPKPKKAGQQKPEQKPKGKQTKKPPRPRAEKEAPKPGKNDEQQAKKRPRAARKKPAVEAKKPAPEKPSIRINTGVLERARDALARVSKRSETPGVAPAPTRFPAEVAGGRLTIATQASYKHRPRKEWPLHYDLDQGGFVLSSDGFLAVFNKDAPPITAAQAGEASNLTRQKIMARYKGSWKPRDRDAVVVDLQDYLQALRPPEHLDYVPVGEEFYRLKDVQTVARAMPGPVLLDSGKNRALYLQQGSNVALVRPFDVGTAYQDLPTAQRYAALAGEASKKS